MGNLVKPDYSKAAGRFLRWRKKNLKPTKPKRVKYWRKS